jgi:two-component system, OmpR family, sensor kinase
METPIETPREALASALTPAAAPEWGMRQRLPWLLLLGAGPVALVLLRLFPSINQVMLASPPAHVAITAAAAMLGIALALLVINTSMRAQDARVFLIGLGLLSIAELFSIHSLSTPDVLLPGRGSITGWSALLSLLVGGVILAVSGLELRPASNCWIMQRAGLILTLFLALWLGVALVLLEPWRPAPAQTPTNRYGDGYSYGDGYGVEGGHSHDTQLDGDTAMLDWRTFATAFGVLCYGFAAWRHFRLYRRSPSATGAAIAAGTLLFGLALISQWQYGQAYSLSFWLYHLQEFAAFGVISFAVLKGYHSGQSGEGLLESLFLGGTRARLQAGYASALQSLIDTIARGEQPGTAQRRDFQARFGLAEGQMRVLEQAAGAVAQERRQRQELEQLNHQLVQLQHDKEQLTQMVVHDLKNPLTALIGFLEIMQLGTARLDEGQRTLLESALRSGKNLTGLIGDLLDAARLEEGKLELDYSLIEPDDLLRDCAGQMGGWLIQEEKTIRIETADAQPALADRRLLQRVLLNLISNAIKHTPPQTVIVLRAFVRDTSLVFEVEDDGDGIAPERLERIFERFGRVAAGERRQQSTALGLSFCRLAVEAHSGTITAESVPGCGALFRISIPLDGPLASSIRA